jgi:dUTPase
MNMTKETQVIEAGTRIWQWVFVKIEKAEFELVETMNNSDRGWFGTTWIK